MAPVVSSRTYVDVLFRSGVRVEFLGVAVTEHRSGLARIGWTPPTLLVRTNCDHLPAPVSSVYLHTGDARFVTRRARS